MRTTADIDDDLLLAVKEMAQATGSTAGKVLSDLARRGLALSRSKERTRNGLPVLQGHGPAAPPLTMKRVNQLRDSE